MSTVVFFNYPAYGHINPTLPIVTELVRRGEKVFYYALEEFQSAIEYTGAIFRSHGKDFPFHLTNAELSTAMSLHCLLQTSQWVLDNLLQEVRAIQPDYIMYDAFCPWGRYIGEILRVPTVSMISGLLMNSRILCGVPSATLEVVSVFIKKYKYTARSQAIANALSKKYNLQRSNIIDLLLNDGMLNIVYTSKAFQPLSSSFDQKHFKFVGPSILPRPQTHPFPFEKLGEKPLIYISLGTIFNKKAAFYRACFEAFTDTDWQVVMTIGRHVCRDSLGPIPSNFIVREFVPQLEILQRTSLFITHGGMNSVSEALYYNVPLVVVPQSADQPWIAKRVVELGVGRSLSPRRVTAKSLRRAAEKIFSQPAYANAAASVGESLRTAGGYKTAADEILNFKRTHGIR